MRSDWAVQAPSLAAPENTVTLWRVALPSFRPWAAHARDLLCAKERVRADRFRNPEHGECFAITRGLLRVLLGAQLEVEPGDVVIEQAGNGKPYVPADGARGVEFSVSHSGAWSLLGVGTGIRIGVDVEREREDVDHESIARRFFGPGERAAIGSVAEAERRRTFYRFWTLKEAVLKAAGQGIAGGLDRVRVSLDDAEPRVRVDDGAGDSVLHEVLELDVAPGYAAAFAVRGAMPTVVLGELTADAFRI